VDGKTVIQVSELTNRGDHPIAVEPLDPSIRPPSNFDARTDPFEVNGGGGRSIMPGGDLQAAYWLLRWLDVREPGEIARSPNARMHRPAVEVPADPAPEAGGDVPGTEDAEAAEDAAARTDVPETDGSEGTVYQPEPQTGSSSGCMAGAWGGAWAGFLPALAAFLLARRRARTH